MQPYYKTPCLEYPSPMAGFSAYLELMNEHVYALPLKYILPSGTLGTVGCGPRLLLQVATRVWAHHSPTYQQS